jgi:hypothetical protein
MKSKNGTQTTRQKILKWLPLLAAYSLIVVWFGLRGYVYEFPLSPTNEWVIFYPPSLKHGLVGLIVIFLHALAFKKSLEKRFVSASAMIAGLLFCGLVVFDSNGRLNDSTYVESLSTEQHMYHLLKYDYHDSWPGRVYIVLECDQTGLLCHYYATPSHCLVKDAHLEQNPITRGLVLSREIYTIDFDQHEKTNETYIGCESRP